jgi:phosphopantetheinyl transferase
LKLHVVLATVAPELRGRAQATEGRRLGALALARSARKARLTGAPKDFPRDEEGVPASFTDKKGATWHWSTTNTRGLVAGVVAQTPVALDAEWRGRSRLDAVRGSSAPDELTKLEGFPEPRELVLWTAKEAVLKVARVGLAGLSKTRLFAVLARDRLVLSYDEKRFAVRTFVLEDHVIAVACGEPRFEVELHELDGVTA